jgi:hypothetical protein
MECDVGKWEVGSWEAIEILQDIDPKLTAATKLVKSIVVSATAPTGAVAYDQIRFRMLLDPKDLLPLGCHTGTRILHLQGCVPMCPQ